MKKKKSARNAGTQKAESGTRTWLNIAIAAGIVALLFVIPAVSGLLSREKPEETTRIPEEVEPTVPDAQLREPEIRSLSAQTYDLGEGITLTEILSVTGDYPEDGASEERENALCIRIHNGSDRTLEYLTADVGCGETEYTFAVSTLPPGETVLAWDKTGQNAPSEAEDIRVTPGYRVFFREEPSLPANLHVGVENGSLSVTNVSDTDITGDFFVYYKNRLNGEYLGGITYRVRVSGGLKAGETYSAYAANSSKARTKVLFADDAS